MFEPGCSPALAARTSPATCGTLGTITNQIGTYSVGSTVYLRTNIFNFDANDIDLLTFTNAIGVQVSSNSYTCSNALDLQSLRPARSHDHKLLGRLAPPGVGLHLRLLLLSWDAERYIVGNRPSADSPVFCGAGLLNRA